MSAIVICVVNVYLDHLKFCVVCMDGRRYACCSVIHLQDQGGGQDY